MKIEVHRSYRICSTALSAVLVAASTWANEPITFEDIATDLASGLVYQRTPSLSNEVLDQRKATQPFFTFADTITSPIKSRGTPGVALLDIDHDSDLDIYVTNGPGTNNSLFVNQLNESGSVTFIDTGSSSGANLSDQDSTGVCFGDIDNDGDEDLYVLGNAESNRLLENQGDGTFLDITATSGAGGGAFTSTSCSFGDVNGDGLLDVAVANAYTDFNISAGITAIPFDLNEPNQLFVNQGGNVFNDESAASGLLENRGFSAADIGKPGLTWAIAMVDYDLDGDVDIFMADDQGMLPFVGPDAVVRGILHLFENDGTGHFVDRTVEAGLNVPGGWMALTFGDLNCDGAMDFFASNFGDFLAQFNSGGQSPIGIFPSRWFLGDGSGGFSMPGLGPLKTTPFGWGAGITDFDNDGDGDIIYHGGMDLILTVEASNGGVLLENSGCSATFTRNTTALASSTNHARRTVQGVAIGDLNSDGFEDIVSASNFDIPEPIPIIPTAIGPFTDAGIIPTFTPLPTPGKFLFTGTMFADGSLSVEINSGDNNNYFAQVSLVGTAGLTTDGRVNRDGIGAVVRATPKGGSSTLHPVVGGSSYSSQHSLTVTIGLGSASNGKIEVLWPGGVRNLLMVKNGEHILFPEIPCSFDEPGLDLAAYADCVDQALSELFNAGVLDEKQKMRFRKDALKAWVDAHIRSLW